MGWIKKRADRPSSWRAGYRGPDGREHSKSFERKIDAERWLRSELQKADLGIWVDPEAGKIVLEDWSAIWMSRRVGLTEKTRVGYQGILNSRVLPTFGVIPLRKVTRTAVAGWVSGMSNEGLSPSRVRNCFNVLAACLDAAVNEGLVGRNPARGAELPAQAAQAEHRYLTAQQVDDLASSVPTLADRSLILTLAYGGLRWGEAVALRGGESTSCAGGCPSPKLRPKCRVVSSSVSPRRTAGDTCISRDSSRMNWPNISTVGRLTRRPWCGWRRKAALCATTRIATEHGIRPSLIRVSRS
jgi:hypothetical protein